MRASFDQDPPQNTQNPAEFGLKRHIVDSVDDSERVKTLLIELRGLGVVLSINPEGRLAFDAPANVVLGSLLERLRADRDGLLRAIGAEVNPKAETKYLPTSSAVFCPWCRSGEYLIEHEAGVRCDQCNREAWQFIGDSTVRCDWSEPAEFDGVFGDPSSLPEPAQATRPERVECSQSSLTFEP